MSHFTASDVLSKICVRPPYFALQDLRADETGAWATVPIEQELGFEGGPICAAEAGRHMAILGLCGLAAFNPDPGRHYYLANKAHFKRHSIESGFNLLTGSAANIFFQRRTGKSHVELSGGDQRLISLDVDYHVLAENTFNRLFKKHGRSQPFDPFANYAKLPQLQNLSIEPARATASLGKVQIDWCSGHFLGYPALPIAILMGTLVKLVGESIVNQEPRSRFLVREAKIEAENLAFAGEEVFLTAEQDHSEGDWLRFNCQAKTAQPQTVGRMEIWIHLLTGAAGCSADALLTDGA